MNLTAELPSRMTCLLCFSQGGLERRTDKKGRPYYTCGLCHFRIFLNNDAQVYGLLFWAKALADGRLVEKARADLERTLEHKHLPVFPPKPVPISRPAPSTSPATRMPTTEADKP